MNKNERKEKLDRELCGLFFNLLNAFCAQCIRVNAKRLADAGSELLGLHQHRNQVANHVYIGAFRQMLPGIRTRTAGALFERNNSKLIAQRRLRFAQLLRRARRSLIQAESGLDADHQQIKNIRQAFSYFLLPV